MSRLQRLLLLASLMVSHHRTYPPHDRPLRIPPRGILSHAGGLALLLNIVNPLAGYRAKAQYGLIGARPAFLHRYFWQFEPQPEAIFAWPASLQTGGALVCGRDPARHYA